MHGMACKAGKFALGMAGALSQSAVFTTRHADHAIPPEVAVVHGIKIFRPRKFFGVCLQDWFHLFPRGMAQPVIIGELLSGIVIGAIANFAADVSGAVTGTTDLGGKSVVERCRINDRIGKGFSRCRSGVAMDRNVVLSRPVAGFTGDPQFGDLGINVERRVCAAVIVGQRARAVAIEADGVPTSGFGLVLVQGRPERL